MSDGRAPRIALDARKLRDFGIGTSIAGLLRGLTAVGMQQELVLLLPRDVAPPDAVPRCTTVRVRARGYGLREHFELPRAARAHGATLYHSPHYVLPRRLRIPATVVIHDLIHLRFPQGLSWAARAYARVMIADAYRRAARVLTPSAATREELLEAFGGDPRRVLVVPNGLDERWLAPAPESAEGLHARLGLPERYVLYTGNDKPHKNLERLVDAFAAAVHGGALEGQVLVLAGAPREAARRLFERARRLSIGDRLRALGRLSFADLRSVTAAARSFVFPSLAEGFGLPPLEAMASGVPVVAADAGAIPEVCGGAALLVDPRDVDSIAAGLARVDGDELLRGGMIERGRARARQFSVEAMARGTLEAWRAVLVRERAYHGAGACGPD